MDFFDDCEDFEDNCPDDLEMDDPFADEHEREGEAEETESQDDDFTTKHAFFTGAAMGFAYIEGLRARKRRKRKRFSHDY